MDSRLPKLIFVLLALYAAVHFSDLYAQLPNVVASHFNARGAANGWQTKQAFFQVLVGITVLAAVLGFAIPQIIVRVPAQFINLPNKDYWLAQEHREETLEWLKAYFAWLACGIYVVMIVAFDYAAESNLHRDHPPDVAHLVYALVGFSAFVIIWLIRMFRRFAHVPNTPGYGAP